MTVTGLGDRALNPAGTRGVLTRHQLDVGPDRGAGEPRPVTDLYRQREPGQRRDPPQATQPAGHRSELAVASHRRDRRIKTVPAGRDPHHGVIAFLERQPRGRGRQPLLTQPHVMPPGPRLPAAIHDPLTQQQLGQPVPGHHQIATTVLARAHQVTGRLLTQARDGHRPHLVQTQQPRQVQGVTLVGLHPITGRPLQLARRRYLAPGPCTGQRPVQPEPRRARLIDRGHRARQTRQPAQDITVIGGQPRPEHLTSDTVDRRRHHRSCVHIQSHEPAALPGGFSGSSVPAFSWAGRGRWLGSRLGAVTAGVLVVEDEVAIGEPLVAALRAGGYGAHKLADRTGLESVVEGLRPDLAVLDLMLPGRGGLPGTRPGHHPTTTPAPAPAFEPGGSSETPGAGRSSAGASEGRG